MSERVQTGQAHSRRTREFRKNLDDLVVMHLQGGLALADALGALRFAVWGLIADAEAPSIIVSDDDEDGEGFRVEGPASAFNEALDKLIQYHHGAPMDDRMTYTEMVGALESWIARIGVALAYDAGPLAL